MGRPSVLPVNCRGSKWDELPSLGARAPGFTSGSPPGLCKIHFSCVSLLNDRPVGRSAAPGTREVHLLLLWLAFDFQEVELKHSGLGKKKKKKRN